MNYCKSWHESSQITTNHDMNHHKSPQTMTWTTMNHDINHHKPWHESLLINTNHDMNHHDDPKRALHKAIWLPCLSSSLFNHNKLRVCIPIDWLIIHQRDRQGCVKDWGIQIKREWVLRFLVYLILCWPQSPKCNDKADHRVYMYHDQNF